MGSAVEEQLIVKSIREECPWENLPKRLQAALVTKDEWHKRIVDHCIKRRLQWNISYARKVSKEAEYYEEMMRYLRKSLALFPYHLADYVCRVMRISPFRYYCDMIFDVMKNEQPYDSIPNFSAADALRLAGIGRNEYIDIMNKCRSKKLMWKLNKAIAKELLPAQPVDFMIEPWWEVCLVNFTIEEFKKLTEEETATIDKICREEGNSFVLFDPNTIKGLYRRGLVYFDVPVFPDDRFRVSRLEGFVSNRDQMYEDPIEELLYAVFVVSSENATVAELAATLQADLSQLQAAASFACRLGWAVKLMDPLAALRDSSMPGLPTVLSDDEDASSVSINSEKSGHQSQNNEMEEPRPISANPHVAFIVDANVTSYLMMGSLSPGLKSHAVTLYEAGKLGDSFIADLCKDLASLEGRKFEGELQEFANHAFSLRCVLECVQSGGVAKDEPGGSNKPISKASTEINTENFLLDVVPSAACEMKTDQESESAAADNGDVVVAAQSDPGVVDVSFSANPGGTISSKENGKDLKKEASGKPGFASKRNYRVDILRCESLAALSPATLERLFLRDYDIVVSMIPLPSSSVLPGSSGPVHFGPPSYSSMTPWMKILLYTIGSCGPLSVVLMKGQRLRLLPEPLAGCEKALIWSWDGLVVGGLGGKFDGNLVKGHLLLHCLNSMLKHSAVLVQPLSRYDLDVSGQVVTMDIALPLKDCDGSFGFPRPGTCLPEDEISNLTSLLSDLSNKLDLDTVGYLHLLRLCRVTKFGNVTADDKTYEWLPLGLEFGVPFFKPELCERICERIVASTILQKDVLTQQLDVMQFLRKRLRDMCSEYQAMGPTAKLFYQKGEVKAAPHQLMTYVSGRWNLDASTPISGSSGEHDRLKLARRHRGRTEVLSFDGNILRSYALSPVYEAATRPIDESSSVNIPKVENEDANSKDVVLPGVNLLFDGAELHPFDIGACLQARQPVLLVAEASAASATLHMTKTST